MMIQKTLIFILALTFCSCNFAQTKNSEIWLNKRAQKHLNGIINHSGKKPIHNVQMSFIYKDNYEFHGTVGLDKSDGEQMSSNHKFKIASTTKTFTSVIILQLMEEGKLKLSDTLPKYFNKDLTSKILLFDGQSFGNSVTIKQLLNHTSGLADYIFDDEDFVKNQMKNPSKSWIPKTIIENYFAQNLNLKGFNKPGEGYHYSDTNFLLLGLIIEKLTNSTLAEQYLERIIKPLGLHNTYLDRNDFDTENIMHQYQDKFNITENLNASFDWAGGGLISTTKDLSIFIRALFNEKLFNNASTLEQMTICNGFSEGNECYGLGINTADIKESIFDKNATGTIKMIGHSGYWGVYMYYFPEKDITAVLSIGQVNHEKAYMPWVRLMRDCYKVFEN